MPAEVLTATDVRRLLDRYGLAPRRLAGQNFVVDPNTVRKVVRDAGVGPDDLVLEVGAGLGSLTLPLAAAAARVVAVEVDAGLVKALQEVLAGVANVEVVHADALAVDLDALVDGGPARLVANLPYNIATPLVVTALEDRAVTDLFVMVQREVGERWVARPGDAAYGAVSVKLAFLAEVETVARVPPTVFHPVPKVDSVTVRGVRRPDAPAEEDRRHLFDVVETAFARRRKTLRNALAAAWSRQEVTDALEAVAAAPTVRGEELPPADFARLAQALPPRHSGRGQRP